MTEYQNWLKSILKTIDTVLPLYNTPCYNMDLEITLSYCNQILKPNTCFYVNIKALTTYDSNVSNSFGSLQKIFIQSDLCLRPLVQIGKIFSAKL